MNTSHDPAAPRKPGRPREFDMPSALDAALLVFRERGYHATSIGDLRAAMQLTAGSIYKAFTDKRSLYLAVFDHYTQQRGSRLTEVLATTTGTGRDKIAALLRFYAESSFDLEGQRGCLVVGSLAELWTLDPEVAARVTAALHRTEVLLAGLIRLGQNDGSIPQGIDTDAAARAMLCLLQGLRVVGKTGRTRADMLAAADLALRLLD
jgi:TetR/AcrR family transcriptional repressor of nem operon